eukprot:143155-Chlamydomonas_euryale.AAC.2
MHACVQGGGLGLGAWSVTQWHVRVTQADPRLEKDPSARRPTRLTGKLACWLGRRAGRRARFCGLHGGGTARGTELSAAVVVGAAPVDGRAALHAPRRLLTAAADAREGAAHGTGSEKSRWGERAPEPAAAAAAVAAAAVADAAGRAAAVRRAPNDGAGGGGSAAATGLCWLIGAGRQMRQHPGAAAVDARASARGGWRGRAHTQGEGSWGVPRAAGASVPGGGRGRATWFEPPGARARYSLLLTLCPSPLRDLAGTRRHDWGGGASNFLT